MILLIESMSDGSAEPYARSDNNGGVYRGVKGREACDHSSIRRPLRVNKASRWLNWKLTSLEPPTPLPILIPSNSPPQNGFQL